MRHDIQPRLFRFEDATKYLACGKTFFYTLIEKGFINKGHAFGTKFVFWTKEELDECADKMKAAAKESAE